MSWASPVEAQGMWSGLYAGAHIGGGFKTLDFTVNDSSQPSVYRVFSGRVTPGLNVGAHIGFDRHVGKLFVVGGEAGFGLLDYHGDARSGPGNDTLAETNGGFAWTATGRVGYVWQLVMPYVAIGALGSTNEAQVVDSCSANPCGNSTGEGSNATSTVRWIVAVGMEFAVKKPVAGRQWAIRVEWLQLEGSPVLNSFSRTVTGVGIPAGTMTPVSVSTEVPPGVLRALVNIRLHK